ncbi:MAG: FimV/HubP family polar landmark protein [Comamonadaceae bacterium]
MIANSHRWHQVAVAVVTLCGLWGPSAMALSLGRITVQSALGEPLRAEVDLLDINADEAASLKPAVASPESFKAAGLDYNPALATLQASLQRRPDGRAYIRLTGERAVNDPFVDLILETRWSSGRIVRDYTLLFDPPNLRIGSSAAPLSAQVNAQVVSRSNNAVSPVAAPTPAPAAAASGSRTPTQTAKVATPPVPRAQASTAPTVATTKVSVKPGDTASKIAASTRPDNVSLDQMLVALLRANPASFMAGNVNRIKAGAILDVPTADQAASTPAAEATQLVVAQSRDFNEFRRKLAQSAPDAPLIAADRLASGPIEARVEEKKPAAAAPDKLTLSKAVIEKVSAEDKLAKERSAKDAADRAAELAKNISDLGKLGSATGAAATPASGATSSTVAAVAASQPLNAGAMTPPGAVASGVKVTPPVVTKPETGVLDSLFENPLLPIGAASLIGLLVLLGVYRSRQRNGRSQADGVMIDNRVRPDTYFAASGGQNVDTHHGAETGSSLVSAPSQLESVGVDDVDPVAEADVYLAYGRDLQAEEILKDALRATPERIAIHQKLLELFAKRRDAKSFQHIAAKAYRLTDSDSLEWQRIRELGLSIDPGNPRYLPGWQPAEAEGKPSMPAPLEESSTRPGALTQSGAAVDLDLDLDFSIDEEPGEPIGETAASVAETAPSGLSATPVIPAPMTPTKPEAPDFDMLKFDLGSLSLDLGDDVAPEASGEPVRTDDPLATKLALSEEFVAIGDVEGARTLIEEVIAEATGDLKLKAKMALSDLQSL